MQIKIFVVVRVLFSSSFLYEKGQLLSGFMREQEGKNTNEKRTIKGVEEEKKWGIFFHSSSLGGWMIEDKRVVAHWRVVLEEKKEK